jgi:hypothetical protein
MGRVLALLFAGLIATIASVLMVRSSSASGPTQFRTPDAAAACRLEATTLVCSSLGSNRSVALPAHGRPSVVSRLPWWDAGTPVMRSFHHGGLSCRLAGAALLCRSERARIRVTGEGFAVSEQ